MQTIPKVCIIKTILYNPMITIKRVNDPTTSECNSHHYYGDSYILPILEYACELWDDCCIRDTQKLECLQLEAARIVTGLPIYSSAESLYFETGWSKLEDRRKSGKLNLFYKIENNMAPTYLSDCLPTTIGETVTYNLRNNDDYCTQR
jgi:hypothetical protein